MSSISRLSANTLTLLVSNAGSAVLSFLLSVMIGRALGEHGLGVYAAALAWVFPLTLLAEFGLGTLITREVAQAPERAGAYLHATHRPRLLLGSGLMLALALAAPLLSSDAAVIQGIRLSAPLVLIAPAFGAYTAVFRARRVMWPIAALNLGMLAAQAGLTLWAFATGRGVLAALAINTLTSAGQMVAAWVIWRFWLTSPPAPLSTYGEGGFRLLRSAWPFALAGVLAAVQARLGFILLEQFAGAGEVGYYAASSRFVEALRLLPNAFFGALFPALAALATNAPRLNQTFRRVLLALAAFGAVSAVGLSLLAVPVIALTYGPDFAPAGGVLQVLGWALLVSLLRAGQTLYWYALGREQYVNWMTMIALLVQGLLSLWLIPAYGAVGAAWGLVGVEVVMVFLLALPVLRRG